MNHYFSEWNIEPDLPVPAASHRKPFRLDQELVELLWENGQVVLNNQTHKNPGIGPKCNQSSSTHVEDSSAVNLQNLVQDNDPVSWNHCQVDDPFEKELSSFLLPELHPITNSALIHDPPPIGQLDSYKFCNIDGSQISNLCANTSQPPPPRVQALNPVQVQVQPHANLGDVAVGINKRVHNNHSPTSNGAGFGGLGAGCMKMRDVRENSVKTVGSSHCGSNQVIYDADISLASCSGIGREIPNTEDNYACKVASQSERSTERETVASLSSGGSGFTSIGGTCNQSIGTHSNKRKGRETENSESQSEAALLESDTRKKSALKSVTTRKCRASEVHNLSERRRRDRINEKMRALQELLPRSNQSDKASMLDDAIQYMKSLQMQLQMMWVGSQMAPMMFPGVSPYMSRLEMGISPPMMPTSLQSAMNLSRLPMMDQARAAAAVASMPNQAGICQPTLLNCINYQNQMQNCNFSDQYGNYIGFYPVQSANQQMNMFSYGPNMTPQNHTLPTPGGDSNGGPHS